MATAVTALCLCNHSRSNLTMYHPPDLKALPPCRILILCVASLTSASKITIEGLLAYYGNDAPGSTPGIFNDIQDYYWWMAGAAWNVHTPSLHSHRSLKGGLGPYAILVVNRRCILQCSCLSSYAVRLSFPFLC